MKAAAIYARVSSEQQKEENTIASQTAALIEFAREQGYSVPDEWVIEDEGFSGASLLRPGLERLRDLAAEGHIQAVLIHSPRPLEQKICLSSPADRRVCPSRSRDDLSEGAAFRHARRSADAAVPGHDCRIRTGADSRTVSPRQAPSRQGRGRLSSGWCALWLPLHPQDQRGAGTLPDRCRRSRSRAAGLRQVYGGRPEHRRDCPAATRDRGPYPSAGSLGTIGRLGDPAQPG